MEVALCSNSMLPGGLHGNVPVRTGVGQQLGLSITWWGRTLCPCRAGDEGIGQEQLTGA